MNTQKKHIYFVPGLAAGPKIFDYLKLPLNLYELHFLEWLMPTSKNETLESYAKRMALLVNHEDAILVGVSFGGIMVQEMSRYLNPEKIILISSIKHPSELSKGLRFIKKTKLYNLFPTKLIAHLDKIIPFIIIPKLKKRILLYQKYLSVRDQNYINWSIQNIMDWQPSSTPTNIFHIQGTKDHIFPIECIKNPIKVKNGTHIMILIKAKEISALLKQIINC